MVISYWLNGVVTLLRPASRTARANLIRQKSGRLWNRKCFGFTFARFSEKPEFILENGLFRFAPFIICTCFAGRGTFKGTGFEFLIYFVISHYIYNNDTDSFGILPYEFSRTIYTYFLKFPTRVPPSLGEPSAYPSSRMVCVRHKC